MMVHHQMVIAMVQVASMVISLRTDTIPVARTTKMVTKMSHAAVVMMTDSQYVEAKRMTAIKSGVLAITKMVNIKVTMNGQMMNANALATASVSVKS